jgi:hypothetical protein
LRVLALVAVVEPDVVLDVVVVSPGYVPDVSPG